MNTIERNTLLLVLKEFHTIYRTFFSVNWVSNDFNNWLDDTYGFYLYNRGYYLVNNNTTKFDKIVVTNQNKKLLFDMKYPT